MTGVFETLYDIKSLCMQSSAANAAQAGGASGQTGQDGSCRAFDAEKDLEPLIEKAGGMMAKAMVR